MTREAPPRLTWVLIARKSCHAACDPTVRADRLEARASSAFNPPAGIVTLPTDSLACG